VQQFLAKYGYLVLFFNVLAEQLGVPVPAVPVFIAMGSLAGSGEVSLIACVVLASVASLIGDVVWYELGRRRGHSILNFLCRVSLEPDSCVSNTTRMWTRFGPGTLVFAKFVPGLSTVAPPLAGLTRMGLWRFIWLDLAGCVVWSGAYLGVGYLFHNQIEIAVEAVRRFGSSLTALVLTGIALYVAWKYYHRRQFIRELRVARVTPEELMNMIAAGEDVTVVDLRSRLEMQADGVRLPSAIWLDRAELDRAPIPVDREVVLYCS
jgi:membrane protein DedA with SNARE-associated domain